VALALPQACAFLLCSTSASQVKFGVDCPILEATPPFCFQAANDEKRSLDQRDGRNDDDDDDDNEVSTRQQEQQTRESWSQLCPNEPFFSSVRTSSNHHHHEDATNDNNFLGLKKTNQTQQVERSTQHQRRNENSRTAELLQGALRAKLPSMPHTQHQPQSSPSQWHFHQRTFLSI
jgi:hypothetical protein